VKPSKTSSTAVIDPSSIPWDELVKEFIKDMNMIGWSISPDTIVDVLDLEKVIKEKLKISPNEITALFYRMGIEENRAGLALANKKMAEGVAEIALLVLNRSKERIILRKRN
jgi:hypothetical protein